PGLAEIGGMREPRCGALDDPDAGAAIAAAGDLFDAPIIQTGHRRALVLDEHLGELASGSHRRAEHPLQQIGLDYILYRHACSSRHSVRWGPSLPRQSPLNTRRN